MKSFYFAHLATGVILIAMLVAFYALRDETVGRSGVAGGGRSGVIDRVEATGSSPRKLTTSRPARAIGRSSPAANRVSRSEPTPRSLGGFAGT